MKLWKKRALELGDWMRAADVEGTGLTFVEIHRRSGHSRPTLRGDLLWLEDVGIVESKIDQSKRRRWRALPEEDIVIDMPPVVMPPEDLLDCSRIQELLDELQSQ